MSSTEELRRKLRNLRAHYKYDRLRVCSVYRHINSSVTPQTGFVLYDGVGVESRVLYRSLYSHQKVLGVSADSEMIYHPPRVHYTALSVPEPKKVCTALVALNTCQSRHLRLPHEDYPEGAFACGRGVLENSELLFLHTIVTKSSKRTLCIDCVRLVEAFSGMVHRAYEELHNEQSHTTRHTTRHNAVHC